MKINNVVLSILIFPITTTTIIWPAAEPTTTNFSEAPPSYEKIMEVEFSPGLNSLLEKAQWHQRKKALNMEQKIEFHDYVSIRQNDDKYMHSDKERLRILIAALEFAEKIKIPLDLHQALQSAGIKSVGRRSEINDVWGQLIAHQNTKAMPSFHINAIINQLIKHGADVNHLSELPRRAEIETPLVFLISIREENIIKNLLKANADVNKIGFQINGQTFTPLTYAKWRGENSILELLEKYDI